MVGAPLQPLPEDGAIRIYLAGTIALERGGALVTEERLPGRQGRLALAMLSTEHERPVSKEELADELWPHGPPEAWDVAIRALVSKLRSAIADILEPSALASAFGCYQLQLPRDAWIDIEAAADAVHRAEAAERAGDDDDAMGWALAANAIARRGFLPGEDGPFSIGRRIELRGIRVRALECRGGILLRRRDAAAAARDAEIAIELEPFRETGHRLLMRAHVAAGNPAEALRAYDRCRTTIVDELGVGPSTETEALHLEILRSV